MSWCLLVICLGSGRCSAMLAEIFVKISGRAHEQESLAGRGRYAAGRTIEQRGIQRSELVCLFLGTWSWGSSCPRR